MTAKQQERQQKKDFLDRYHDLMLRARCKRLMVEQLREDYQSVRGIDYSSTGIPRSKGHTSDLSGMYARIDEHRRELDATLQQAERVYRLVKRELDALDDPKGACIISIGISPGNHGRESRRRSAWRRSHRREKYTRDQLIGWKYQRNTKREEIE